MSCRINITNIEQWNYWFQEFCSLSGTSYNKSKSDEDGTNKVRLSGNRKCIHNVKQQNVDVNSDKMDSARQGPGRKKGQERVPGKHTSCPSKSSFQLAGDKLNQSKKSSIEKQKDVQTFPSMVKINYEHNHSINSADALRYRPVGDEVKRELTSAEGIRLTRTKLWNNTVTTTWQ